MSLPWRRFLLLLWAASCGAAGAQPAGARVLFASGPVEVVRQDARLGLATGDALAPGDAVTAGAGARAQLLLADGSRLAIQEGSQVRLAAAGPVLDFSAGSVRVWRGPGAGEFVLRTQRAAVRVRGPAFSAGYNPDGSVNIASEREPVEVCTAGGCVGAGDDNLRVRSDAMAPTRTNARASWR